MKKKNKSRKSLNEIAFVANFQAIFINNDVKFQLRAILFQDKNKAHSSSSKFAVGYLFAGTQNFSTCPG